MCKMLIILNDIILHASYHGGCLQEKEDFCAAVSISGPVRGKKTGRGSAESQQKFVCSLAKPLSVDRLVIKTLINA